MGAAHALMSSSLATQTSSTGRNRLSHRLLHLRVLSTSSMMARTVSWTRVGSGLASFSFLACSVATMYSVPRLPMSTRLNGAFSRLLFARRSLSSSSRAFDTSTSADAEVGLSFSPLSFCRQKLRHPHPQLLSHHR